MVTARYVFGSAGLARLVNEAKVGSGACAGWATTWTKYDLDWDCMETECIMNRYTAYVTHSLFTSPRKLNAMHGVIALALINPTHRHKSLM